MSDEASFGRWLKQRRKQLDLTQSMLTEQVGCAAESLLTLCCACVQRTKHGCHYGEVQYHYAPLGRAASGTIAIGKLNRFARRCRPGCLVLGVGGGMPRAAGNGGSHSSEVEERG
jgi:hypothetical protein